MLFCRAIKKVNKQMDTSKYYFFACISIVIGLLTQDFFKIPLTGGMIAIGLTWIFSFSLKDKLKNLIHKPLVLSLMLFYLLHLMSMIYTENTSVGWNDLLLKVSIFLLPLFMMSTSFISRQKSFQILKVFALLMMVMAASDLVLSFLDYRERGNSDAFFYVGLTHFIPGQPHYVSWYYSMALFISLYHILNGCNKKFLWCLGSILLTVSLVLLTSRAFYIAFSVVFLASVIKAYKSSFLSKQNLGLIFLGLGLFVIGIISIPNTSKRINDAKNEVKSLMGTSTKYTNPRIYLWKHSVEIIAEEPLLGYGVGDAKKILIGTFKEKNIPFSGNNYNFHNQYLQSWTEVGILGVILLMFMLLRPFFEKVQHPLFLIFLGLTLIGFMTESMLERQAGVVFFAFMYPLLSGLRGKEVE